MKGIKTCGATKWQRAFSEVGADSPFTKKAPNTKVRVSCWCPASVKHNRIINAPSVCIALIPPNPGALERQPICDATPPHILFSRFSENTKKSSWVLRTLTRHANVVNECVSIFTFYKNHKTLLWKQRSGIGIIENRPVPE